MTPELQRYYEQAFSMMATEGWKDFMDDVQRIANSYDKLSSVTETHTLDFRRGQMDILNWMLGLRTAYEETYDQLSQESN